MNKCVFISDSFKGSLSTFELIDIFKDCFSSIFPNCELLSFPCADGGEGTSEVFSYIFKGNTIKLMSKDANLNDIETSYFLSEDNIAYIDVASCISLPKTNDKNPMKTTSYGVGLLIKDAINRNIKKIYLGLGGSSTNDMGLGIVSSLGGKFFDADKNEFLPTGGNLNLISDMDLTEFYKNISGIKINGLCDVKNKLLGKDGASLVFSLQKGATEKEGQILEKNMSILVKFLLSKSFDNIFDIDGSGAAGGIGACLLSFFKGRLISGIDYLLETIDFEDKIKDADVIFTGEGKFDNQSKEGKAIDGIRKIAYKYNVPVVVIAGGASMNSEDMINKGIASIVTTNRLPLAFEDIKEKSKIFYKMTVLNTLRLIELGEKISEHK